MDECAIASWAHTHQQEEQLSLPPAAAMQAWAVADVKAFLRARDLWVSLTCATSMVSTVVTSTASAPIRLETSCG